MYTLIIYMYIFILIDSHACTIAQLSTGSLKDLLH